MYLQEKTGLIYLEYNQCYVHRHFISTIEVTYKMSTKKVSYDWI